jgi:anti-anti-sigma factor
MEIVTTADGPLATIAIAGTVDTRASTEFEGALTKTLEAGARQVIIDLSRLDLVTSAGIRVLVLFAKRLSAIGGGFGLCCLSPDVKRVFDISGLTGQFRIFATLAEAKSVLSGMPAPKPARGSRITRLVGTLLGGRGEVGAPRRASEPSPLAKQIASLLAERHEPLGKAR